MESKNKHYKIGLRIKRLRKELKLSQEEFALTLGIDRSELSRIENGKRCPEWLDRFVSLSFLLLKSGKDVMWLVEPDPLFDPDLSDN